MKIENYKLKISKGFTLIEILLYTAIFAVVGGLTVGILLTVTQVQQRESAGAEVTGQLNFIMQTVQRLVSKSSNIEIEPGIATSTLKLRMEDSAKDPTCLSLVGGLIKLAEGPGANPNNCTTVTSDLTNSRVIVNTFNFKKFTQYPGHDTVSIDLTMTYNTTNPKGQVQRTLSSAIARVSAATFDSNLLPGSATFEIGQAGASWKNLYLSGVLNLGTAASDPAGQNGSIYYNTASSTFRGYKAGTWSDLGASFWNSSGNNIYNINSGNVGIGTTTPTHKLVVGSGATNSINSNFQLLSTAASDSRMGPVVNNVVAALRTAGAFAELYGYNYGSSTAVNLILNQFGGNVGIGTTTPAYALDVLGSIRASNSIYASGTIIGSGGRASVYQSAVGCGSSLTTNTTCTTLACSSGKVAGYYSCAGVCDQVYPVGCSNIFAGYLH